MMLWLMLLLLATCITGISLRTEYFRGNEIMETLHALFANSILIFAALHVFAAIFESFRWKENLILSMITGYKKKNI